MIEAKSKNLIEHRTYNNNPLDEELRPAVSSGRLPPFAIARVTSTSASSAGRARSSLARSRLF
jgi:hypothetical protein